jgi:two-component sensor histidine kinase
MTRFEFVRSRLLAPPPPPLHAVPLALPFIAAPTAVRWLIDPLDTGTAFVAYYPFVLLAALLLGWRTAAIVMMGSAVVANFLFMEPRYVLFAGPSDTLGAAFYCISSSLIIAVADTLKRAVVEVQAGARREADLNAQLHHLNSELQHRVKNTLMVVQGLAVQTFRGTSAEAELRTFRGRLQALAEAHDVLTSGRWEGCQLPDLAMRALAPFNGQGAVRIDGPACTLPEAACIPLVLALHELGTNAVKHGALSSLSGAVDVVWSVVAAQGAQQVVLQWTETEGPKVEPPRRAGLGSRLLKPQRGLDDVALEFSPDGLRCHIVVGGAAEWGDGRRAVS